MSKLRTTWLGFVAAAGAALFVGAPEAEAGEDGWKKHRHHHHHYYGGHYYKPPKIKYYTPRPVYYVPAPTYYAPPPVYYAPVQPGVSINIPLR
jgi:hypothetical protein